MPFPHRLFGRRCPSRASFAAKSIALVLVLVLVAAACSDDDDDGGDDAADQSDGGGDAPAPEAPIIFNGQGNDLAAYESEAPFESQFVYESFEDDPENGRDVNAQICFFPDGSGRFVAGEDTNQPDPPAGWGIFQLSGDAVGDLSAEQVGKLTPTYQEGDDPENYGCGFLSDGRILTTDIGNQFPGDPGTGQLIVWFPPFDSFEVAYCKVDIEIATAGQIMVDEEDNVYVASNRPPTSGIIRYSGDFPTSPDAEGGCGRTDPTGEPLIDEGAVTTETVVPGGDHGLLSPSAIVASGNGTYYVSSVSTGSINEYDENFEFVRTILAPPEGTPLGPEPFPHGTPFGLGVDSEGTLYYADLGVVRNGTEIGPGDGTGTVRRITFVDGEPQEPEIMDEGLAFPDGIGILE